MATKDVIDQLEGRQIYVNLAPWFGLELLTNANEDATASRRQYETNTHI
jgi:hypothetical protein